MAGSMSRCGKHSCFGENMRSILDQFYAFCQEMQRDLNTGSAFCRIIEAMPFGASYQKTSIGEGDDRLPINDLTGPTDMITVQVRKENSLDVGWINPGFFEILEECPPCNVTIGPSESAGP